MRRIIYFSVLLCAAIGLISCSRSENANTSNTLNTNVANTTAARNVNANTAATGSAASLDAADRTFVNEAAVGGMAEVQLGQLAVKNAKSPDVKNFGQRMIDDHTRANNELKQLAASKGITLPADLDAKHKETVDRLSKLTGEQFDKAYMKDMVEDHTKDVADFRKEASEAGNPDVKAFAAKTLPTLEEHLNLAKSIDSKVQKEK
jgi:putative membrane protein